MNSQIPKPKTPWVLIVLFFVILISVFIVGILYYHNRKEMLLVEKQKELSAISNLKIRQITQWRFERIGDGRFLGDNILMVKKFSEFFHYPANPENRELILQSLKSLTENFDYQNVLLFDVKGNVQFAYPEQDTLVGDHLRPMIPGLITNRKVILTDLHKASIKGSVHLDLIVPLIDRNLNDTLVLGLLVLRVDPQKILYPLIQSWPTPSKSAETLLLRNEGNEIVYLNELRHLKNTEMVLRMPLSSDKLPAAMAIQGIGGTLNGIDYRNVRVVASMKKIPGTSWYMVAKIDRQEVFSVLNNQMIMVISILILCISTIGLFLGVIWWNQRVRFYRERYESELSRLALVKHFDYILKFANDIILLIDKDLRIVEANDRALETYMYSRDELLGMKLENIRAPETLLQLKEQIIMINENESATFETQHKRRDNTIFPIEISSRLVNIEGAKYYQTIGRDITERKYAENSLRESELKFRKIFEESPFPMAMTGKDFGITRANSAFCEMIGYEEEELKAISFNAFTHPDHVDEDEVALLRMVKGEIPIYQTEKRYCRKDGPIIWGSTTVSIIRNDRDEVQLFIAMVEDITKRKEAEIELEKSFSLIKATLESTEDGLLVVDLSGKIVQFNKRFAEMWRLPDKILESGSDDDALSFVKDQLTNPDTFIDNVRQLYSKPESTTSDILEFKDGSVFERYSQPQMINGTSVGRVWSFRDITAKKKAESDLIAAKVRAEESDKLKTAFLHNVSHEIRTPMNAIIGFSALLAEPDVNESDRQQYINIIFQSGSQLLSIINDIVDVANIESGQVKVNMKEIDLNATLISLTEQFGYKDKKIEVPLNLTTGLPDNKANIVTDSTKLIQILSNLISNAIKFTKEGQIDFGYVLKDKYLEFFVKDTGIGITPDHLGKIFDRFYQVERTVSRQFGGTGLGLSICKAYVELLGGSINVESQTGKGTKFTFSLPYVPVK